MKKRIIIIIIIIIINTLVPADHSELYSYSQRKRRERVKNVLRAYWARIESTQSKVGTHRAQGKRIIDGRTMNT